MSKPLSDYRPSRPLRTLDMADAERLAEAFESGKPERLRRRKA